MRKPTPWEAVALFRALAPSIKPAKTTCPECQTGTLDIVEATIGETYHPGYHVADQELPVRERQCIAAACNACEYVVEVKL